MNIFTLMTFILLNSLSLIFCDNGFLRLNNFCSCRIRSKLKNYLESNSSSYFIPWVVMINVFDEPTCSGVIINKNSVLTSANCIRDANLEQMPEVLKIIVGTKNISTIEDTDIYKVNRVDKPMDFSSYDLMNGNDIAILKIVGHFNLERKKVEIACIDFNYTNKKYAEMIASGYGRVDPNDDDLSESMIHVFLENKEPKHLNTIPAKAMNERVVCDQLFGGPLMGIDENGLARVRNNEK